MTDHVADFLMYCKHYSYGRLRKRPLYPETLGRYERGLRLAERIIGHSLNDITEEDQLKLLRVLPDYKQGTRKVTIEIVQRYIAFLIREGRYAGPNLLVGREIEIIGEWEQRKTPKIASPYMIRKLFKNIKTDEFRIVLGLMYYGGLTAEEIASIKPDAITDKGIFVWRRVWQKMQLLPLPARFLTDLTEYAKDKERLFFFSGSSKARSQVANVLSQATKEACVLEHMTMGDFRKTAIRHFYDDCYDLDMTKEFAGVDAGKRGWLDTLQDEASSYMETVSRGRTYYGKTNVGSGERTRASGGSELRTHEH
jgi:integrase